MRNQTDELLALSGDLVVYAARVTRALRQGIDPQIPAAGMRVLSLLDEHGPVGVTRLAELDRCSQPTMSGAVRALEQRGWVTKSPRPDDARATVVEATDAGRAALADVRRHHAEVIAARLRHHRDDGTEDLATAVAVLRAVLDATEKEEE
jgi:DNA-binding MarR family transcriptional regulator